MIIKGIKLTEAYRIQELLGNACKVELFDDMLELADAVIDTGAGVDIEILSNHSHANLKFHTARGIKSFKLCGSDYISIVIV